MIAALMVLALPVARAPALAQGMGQGRGMMGQGQGMGHGMTGQNRATVMTQCKNEIAQFRRDKTQGEAPRTCLTTTST